MRILFTGPLVDMSGFAHASRDLLHSLTIDDRLDVVARSLIYDQLDPGQSFSKPDWMKLLLEKPLENIELAIQMTTCNVEAVPVPGVPNGLYTFFETDRLQPSWAAKAQEFDFLIVPSKYNAETLLRSGVTKPILVASPPCDKDIYSKTYEPFKIEKSEGRTVFYNICQLSTKKGIDCLLRAYYAAFAGMPNEVLLVLKTYVNMAGRTNDLEIVKQYIQGVKIRCRIPVQNLPPVLPLVYTMTDDEIHGVHARGDAYVCSSRAEGHCIPAFDALAHGKTLISHDKTGLAGFVTKENSLIYNGTTSFFYDMPHPDPMLFTGLEQCFEPSVAEMALVMQRFHLLKKGFEAGQLNENNQREWQSVLQRRINGAQVGNTYDYRKVGPKVVDQLLAALKSWKETGIVRYDKPAESLEESL